MTTQSQLNTDSQPETLSVLRFSGTDAANFLHKQLTADINALNEGESTFACLCQPKGRVIALFLVWRFEDCCEVILSSSLRDPVHQWLKRFVFRDDVTIEAIDGVGVEVYQGIPEKDHCSPLPGLCYALDEPGLSSAKAIDAQRAMELEAGIVWLNTSTTEQFLPQMLGAGHINALNFRKGCYPGQEIVARTHYLGKLKQRPVLVRLPAAVSNPEHMQKVQLGDSGNQSVMVDATVAAHALHEDGQQRVLLVARAQELKEVDSLILGETRVPVSTHWFPVDLQKP